MTSSFAAVITTTTTRCRQLARHLNTLSLSAYMVVSQMWMALPDLGILVSTSAGEPFVGVVLSNSTVSLSLASLTFHPIASCICVHSGRDESVHPHPRSICRLNTVDFCQCLGPRHRFFISFLSGWRLLAQ